MAAIDDLTGKRMWLRAKDLGADGSSVTSWPDQSGMGMYSTALGTAPLVLAGATPNGGKAVDFSAGAIGIRRSYVTASSFYDSGYAPTNCADDRTTSYWHTASTTMPQWWQEQFTVPKVVTGYAITVESSSGPGSWVFQGSNNGTTWVDLDTRTGYTWSGTEQKSFTFSNTTAYSYVRIYVTVAPVGWLRWRDVTLTGGSTLGPASGDGELWMVVKSDTNTSTSQGAWQFGATSSNAHYPYSGTVYEEAGSLASRQDFYPTLAITSWRIYRVRVTGTTWTAYLDGVLQKTVTGLTSGWRSNYAVIGRNYGDMNFDGKIAEVLWFDHALNSTEASTVSAYLDAEHFAVSVALTSPTASATAPAASATAVVSTTELTSPTASATAAASPATIPATSTSLTSPTATATAAAVPATVSLAALGLLPPTATAVVAAEPATVAINVLDIGLTSPTPSAIAYANAGVVTYAGTINLTSPTATASLGALPETLTLQTISLVSPRATASTAAWSGWIGASEPIRITHTATSSMTTDLSSSTPLLISHLCGSKHVARLGRFIAIDPLTGKPQYRLVIVNRDGTRVQELDQVRMDRYEQQLNAGSSLDFTMSRTDPKIESVKVPLSEIQLWRGGTLEDWMVVTRARGNGSTVSFTADSLGWYLINRVIGKVPIPNLLMNGSFESKELYWKFSYVPGSIPAKNPIHRVVNDTINGDYALYIEGASGWLDSHLRLMADAHFAFDSATLTSEGIAAINDLMSQINVDNPSLQCEGHTDSVSSYEYNYALGLARANAAKAQILSQKPNANVTVKSYGERRPLKSNATPEGRAENRRVEIYAQSALTAKGHQQYAGQSFTYTNPTSAKKAKTLTLVGWMKIQEFVSTAKGGWAVYMQAVEIAPAHPTPEKAYKTAGVTISADSPVNRWIRMECSFDIPADGKTYRIDTRLYPPEGKCIWDEITVTASDALSFFDVDQALIVKGLVEHAQDPAMGKSDLGIKTDTPLTGVTRTREYPWIERMQITEALDEFPTLADGMDITFSFTPTTKTLRTHYPRKSTKAPIPLVLGANVLAYSADIDGVITTSQVIVQAEGEGSDREEGVWTDTSKTEGIILEKVYNATPGSAISSLRSQAKRGVKRWGKPVVMLTLKMDPRYTEELMASISLGDVVDVVISDGWVNIDKEYRVTGRSLDAVSDQITYAIIEEYDLP